ncbi:MAG: universal stress protein [Candidatus Bathyarchaeales archaeon]
MEKILVGLDGSEHSKKALKEAIKLAKKFEATITAVNVFHPAPTPSAHEFSHKILEDAKAVLESEKVKYQLISATGTDPAKAIMDIASRDKYDLIVIGSRGVGAVHTLVLGSVCNRISCESPINVLIVK